MTEKGNTTVTLKKRTVQRLSALKEYKHETRDDVVTRLLDVVESERSPKEPAGPERARA